MSKSLDCYRVPVYITGLYRMPIVAATSPVDAKARAAELAEDMLRKRPEWLTEGGVIRPHRRAYLPIEIGEPVLAHPKGVHP